MQYRLSSPLPPAMKSKQTWPVHNVSLQASSVHCSICTAWVASCQFASEMHIAEIVSSYTRPHVR